MELEGQVLSDLLAGIKVGANCMLGSLGSFTKLQMHLAVDLPFLLLGISPKLIMYQ